jgi:hypothetical protein
MLLRALEEASMCLKLSLRDVRYTALIAVKTCSKGIFGVLSGHGKSPCFLRCCFFAVVGVDCGVLVFASVDVGEFLECAFWYGKL